VGGSVTGAQVAVGESMLAAFLLALARTGGFVFITPPFNTRSVPAKVKAAFSAGLALPMSLTYSDPPALGSTTMILDMALQVLTGLALGFGVLAAVLTIEATGNLLDLVGGFSITMAMDPLMMMQTSVLGRLHQMTAVALLFVTDGHLMILQALTRGFQTMPKSLTTWGDAAQVATEALASLFAGALQIAAPVIAAMLIADVALGLLTRAAPALNAFAMSYPLKILFTLILTLLMAPRLVEALHILVSGAVTEVLRLAGGG
jgi:flagellar biosynthetic protein FliR